MHDRQGVFGGRAPDRVEARVIDRGFVDLRLDRDGPLRFPPFPDFLDRAVGIARRGDDRSLQPVRILPAEIRHVAMEGADHAGFERDVIDADQARPAAGHEEMHVGPLVVHVGDAVGGIVVLHARTRHFRAHPHRVAAAVVGPRRRLAEHPCDRIAAGCDSRAMRLDIRPIAASACGRAPVPSGAGGSRDRHSVQ